MVERRYSLSKDAVKAEAIASDSVGREELKKSCVGQQELLFEEVDVTVAAGATSGTATVTAGSKIVGYYPTGNQDQFVDNISISATTLTLTLAAAAVADNTFRVFLLKP